MRFDIAIAGAGLNGTTLAIALAASGFQVALIDPHPVSEVTNDGFDGRGYALALASQQLLSALRLWPALAEHAQPMLDIKVSDGKPGEGPSPFVMEFSHAEIEEGPMGYMVEDRHIRQLLVAASQDNDRITRFDGLSVVAEKADAAKIDVTFSDKTQITCTLLIACDGKRSPIAARAGIKRQVRDYRQTALVCAVAHEASHNGVAHQFFMPNGPLAILPLTGNRSSIVWAETTEFAEHMKSATDADFLAALRPRFGDFLGQIELAGKRFAYPLSLSIADTFVAPRLALVGDAAHAVHPIAGQGLNAGLKDVAALTEVLTLARRRGEDIGREDVLARYQRWRRFDTNALALATDGFNRLFSNDIPALRLARDLGMGAVNAIPGLRRGFIREAAGLTGDLPALLRGRPL